MIDLLLPTNVNCSNLDASSVKCECSCIICPNVQKFCPNNGQFSSIIPGIPSPYAYAFDKSNNAEQVYIVYRKKSLPSKESATKDLTEYIFRLRGRHHQFCEVHEE